MKKIVLKLKPVALYGDTFFTQKDEGDNSSMLLCREKMIELFTLPRKKTTPITLMISERKMQNAYQVRFKEGAHDCEMHYGGGWNHECLTGHAEEFIDDNNLRGKTVWVTLYWEE